MNHPSITLTALAVIIVTSGCASSRLPGTQVNAVDRTVFRDHYERQTAVHPARL